MGRIRLGAGLALLIALGCCAPALAAPAGALKHVGTLESGPLSNGSGATISPDGRHAYGLGFAADAIGAFSRNAKTGALAFASSASGDGLQSPEDIVISPDGENAYVSGHVSNSVHAYSRAQNGSLSFIDAEVDGQGAVEGLGGAYDLAISPDGKHIYVAGADDDAVALLGRLENGQLQWQDAFINGLEGITGLLEPRGIAVSPDGRNVYVAAAQLGAVVTFRRFAATGQLDFVEYALVPSTSHDVAVSPDGKRVYVASNDGVRSYKRQKQTGALAGPVRTETGGNALGLAVAPASDNVYVAAGAGVETMAVRKNGSLRSLEFDANPDLTGATGVDVSPDGRHVIVVGGGIGDGAIAAYSRQPKLVLRGKAKQTAGKVVVRASCTAACKVTVSGKRLRRASKRLRPGETKKLRLRPKAGGPAPGKLTLRGKARAGNRQAKARLRIRIK
jgi:DNA-binding beta-propeller fold protein YncE